MVQSLNRTITIPFSFNRNPTAKERTLHDADMLEMRELALRDLDEAIDAALAWDDIDRAFVAVTKRAEMIFDESIATEQQSLAMAKRALTNRIEQLRSKAN